MELNISPWVSWRSYKVGTVESRSIVSDERKGRYYLFEQESSDIWNIIACGATSQGLYQAATRLGCCQELDEFLINLETNALILVEPTARSRCIERCESPISIDSDEKKNNKLISDMSEWALDNGFLWSVHWELTYRCNQKCIHCFNPVSHRERNSKSSTTSSSELTTIEVTKVLDDLAELGVFELTLSGGEATLRPDFIEILSYARKKGFCVAILTNGTAINESVAIEIASLWPNLVGISVYSTNPIEHDNVTNIPGSYQKSIETLKIFASNGIQVKVNCVLTCDTIKGFQLVGDLGDELGAITEFDVSIFPKMDGDITPQEYQIASQDELILLAATPGSPIEVKGTSEELKNGSARFTNPEDPICRAGLLSICLNPYGEVSPCLLFPVYLGSVRTNTVKEIWMHNVLGGDWAFPENERHANKENAKIRDLEECGEYTYCSYCPTCPGKAYLETGNPLLSSPSNCTIAKARQQAAELLAKGLKQNDIAQLKGLPSCFGRI